MQCGQFLVSLHKYRLQGFVPAPCPFLSLVSSISVPPSCHSSPSPDKHHLTATQLAVLIFLDLGRGLRVEVCSCSQRNVSKTEHHLDTPVCLSQQTSSLKETGKESFYAWVIDSNVFKSSLSSLPLSLCEHKPPPPETLRCPFARVLANRYFGVMVMGNFTLQIKKITTLTVLILQKLQRSTTNLLLSSLGAETVTHSYNPSIQHKMLQELDA